MSHKADVIIPIWKELIDSSYKRPDNFSPNRDPVQTWIFQILFHNCLCSTLTMMIRSTL